MLITSGNLALRIKNKVSDFYLLMSCDLNLNLTLEIFLFHFLLLEIGVIY